MVLFVECFTPSEWECAEALREVKWAGDVEYVYCIGRDVAAKTLLRRLFKNVKLDGMEAVYTDDYPAYNFLDSLAHHETVNHSSGEVCKGKSPHKHC